MINLNNRVDFFDYLRAFAIAFVVIVHYSSLLLPGGSISVSIFFCLSGFLITTLLLREPKLNLGNAGRFIFRRFMRVYPAYLFSILITFSLMRFTESDKISLLIDAMPGLLTFTHMPKWIVMATGVYWTLHIEFWFYLLMPFIVMLLGKGTKLYIGFLVLIVFSLLYKLQVVADISLPVFLPFTTVLSWMDNLLYGAVVALFSFHNKIKIRKSVQMPLFLLSILAISLIALFISNADRKLTWPLMATATSLLTAIIIMLYLSDLQKRIDAFSKTIISKPIGWLGMISYSVYLVHAIPLDYFYMMPKKVMHLTPLIVLLVSILSYFVIEKSGIWFGRWVTRLRTVN